MQEKSGYQGLREREKPRTQLPLYSPHRVTCPQRQRQGLLLSYSPLTSPLSQGGLTIRAQCQQPVWGGQGPRSQATETEGRPGNRPCYDASGSQGAVSQSHAGRGHYVPSCPGGLQTKSGHAWEWPKDRSLSGLTLAAGQRGQLGPTEAPSGDLGPKISLLSINKP